MKKTIRGVLECQNCGKRYNPTYNTKCPNCGK